MPAMHLQSIEHSLPVVALKDRGSTFLARPTMFSISIVTVFYTAVTISSFGNNPNDYAQSYLYNFTSVDNMHVVLNLFQSVKEM